MNEPLSPYGWDRHWSDRLDVFLSSAEATEVADPAPGRVVRHDGAGLIVALGTGSVRAMFGPPVVPPPVVGDWVVLDRHHTPQAVSYTHLRCRRRG